MEIERNARGASGSIFRRRRRAYKSVAVVVVLALFLTVWLGAVWISSVPTTSREAAVAALTRVEPVPDVEELGFGQPLRAGDRLSLPHGLAEIDLLGLGRLVLEGPAELEFTGPMSARLDRGRAVLRVTPAGRGYRLTTPRGELVDLGTEFAVAVEAGGVVETQVLEGALTAVSADGESTLLRENEALRLAESGAERGDLREAAFYTALPPERTGQPDRIHWRLDESRGGSASAMAVGFSSSEDGLVFQAADAGAGPAWVGGVFGSGLAFDGRGAYASGDFARWKSGEPLTLAFWLRLPSGEAAGGTVVSWQSRAGTSGPGSIWNVSVGSAGKLQLDAGGDGIVAASDLRDGEWHHVAVVLFGASRPELGKHAMIYVDGRLENLDRRSLREVVQPQLPGESSLRLGARLAFPEETAFFAGDLDELHLFRAALSQREILRLMQHNEAP